MVVFFFFKQKTAYELLRSLVGSEMCIRDSPPDEQADFQKALVLYQTFKGDPTVNPQGLVEVVMDLMNLKEKNKLLGLAPTARSMSANPLQASGGPTMVPNGINPNSQELPDLAALRTALGNRGGPV